jgi:hypothetical protein
MSTEAPAELSTTIRGKKFAVKQTNGKFFYWSSLALRWLPVARAKVEGL